MKTFEIFKPQTGEVVLEVKAEMIYPYMHDAEWFTAFIGDGNVAIVRLPMSYGYQVREKVFGGVSPQE